MKEYRFINEDEHKLSKHQQELTYTFRDRPVLCPKCGETYTYKSMGIYECPNCGHFEMDDYGKIRNFLEDNGPTSAIALSEATGVSLGSITKLLHEGRIEIPDGSNAFIKCELCGTSIRFGRICPTCSARLSKEKNKRTYTAYEVGEVPRGKMRYLDKDTKGNKR